MFWIWEVAEIELSIGLLNSELHIESFCRIDFAGDRITIIANSTGEDSVNFIIYHVLPFQRNISVPIIVSGITIKFEPIFTHIGREINTIFIIEFMADMSVDVIKCCLAILQCLGV